MTSLFLWFIFALNMIFYLSPFALGVLAFHEGESINTSGFVVELGVLLVLLGRLITLSAAITLHQNGITQLITKGVFAISRNPIVLGMHVTIIGLTILVQEYWLLYFFPFYWANFHFKILAEEKHLIKKFDDSFTSYSSQTRRYL